MELCKSAVDLASRAGAGWHTQRFVWLAAICSLTELFQIQKVNFFAVLGLSGRERYTPSEFFSRPVFFFRAWLKTQQDEQCPLSPRLDGATVQAQILSWAFDILPLSPQKLLAVVVSGLIQLTSSVDKKQGFRVGFLNAFKVNLREVLPFGIVVGIFADEVRTACP